MPGLPCSPALVVMPTIKGSSVLWRKASRCGLAIPWSGVELLCFGRVERVEPSSIGILDYIVRHMEVLLDFRMKL
jgi:hypothetical protein